MRKQNKSSVDASSVDGISRSRSVRFNSIFPGKHEQQVKVGVVFVENLKDDRRLLQHQHVTFNLSQSSSTTCQFTSDTSVEFEVLKVIRFIVFCVLKL